jgi:RNA polymerase sigma-70 factor (ECF subfamily)
LAVNTNEIWEEFSDRLKRFILKRVQDEHDAEDILQEIFCKIHHHIDHLKDRDKLQSWVYQVTRNTIIDFYRSRKVMIELPEIPEDAIHTPVTDVDAANEVALCLKPMIDHLPDKYRQATLLTEFEGLTQQEMAEQLGLSLSGAKSRVQRARETLKEMLLACCHFEFDRRGHILDYHEARGCRACSGDPTGG